MNELRPKLFDVMKGYTKEQLIKDIISGIIVAIIALPLSIALAIASGVGPEQGLYTAIIAGFFISFFGGSRVQIGGPTAAFVVIIYGIVEQYGTDGLIVATILAGIILVIMGICRFGSLIKYIPYTITTGFTCGIAVTLFVGQLKDFFGLEIASVPSEFLNKVIAYVQNISTINLTSTIIGVVAIIIMLFWPKVTDKIPGSLIAIIITTAIVYFAKLPVNTIGSVYGELNSAFPTFHAPALSMKLVQEMISPAFTIAILAGIESLLSAVVSDGMIGDTHKSNAELIGQGLGNIFSGLFGGIPATGAIARTAANVRSAFTKGSGNVGTPGCVSFMFDKKGQIIVAKEDCEMEADDLMMMALDAGAEDFNEEEDSFEVLTAPDDFSAVREALEKAGIPMVEAQVAMVPQTYVDLTDEKDVKNLQRTLDLLDEDDDVQAVYHNWDE